MDLVTGAMGNIAPKLLQLLRDEYNLQKGLKEKVQSVSDELEHVSALLRKVAEVPLDQLDEQVPIAPKLLQLLRDEYNLQKGLKEKVQSIYALLRKVAEVPWDQLDEQVKIWLDQLREKSYDIQDILDTFLVHVEGPVRSHKKDGKLKRKLKKKVDSLFSLFSKGKARHDIAGAIEDIEKQHQKVAERRARYKLDDVVAKPAATSTIDPRLVVAMNIVVKKLIGIDKSSGELSRMLSPVGNDSTGKTKIVSVVGVGGLGKTTLAQAVYDKLNPNFGHRAFVPVGRDRDVKRVLRDILIDLDKKYMDLNCNILEEWQLIIELKYFLQNKRYFIVIDDVWSTETWNIIKTAFVENDSGSRVIMTTRKREVASMAEEVYYLPPLSYDDSKMLLYTRLYDGEGKCPANHPAEASEKILKKCGGVPLAIITMASMLVGKSTEDWYALCDSPGFYKGNDSQQVHDTKWILSLSYYDLPLNLRTCLLYLSVYPEDCLIEKDPLIWKWIAEGFVEMKTGTTLFERGEEYFNQLINSSLIQGESSQRTGTIIDRCRVHDMVLDLVRDLSKKVNFVTISNDDGEGTSQRNKQVRRLAHHNRSMKQTQEEEDMGMPKVRSLVVCGSKIDSWFLHPSFELLRVLAIEGCRYVPDWQGLRHLGNLVHLRYLGLGGTSIFELPEEIGKLKFLQTLDLECCDIRLLPSGVCQLTQLLCLRGHYYTGAPDGFLKKVTSLEELCINIDNLDDESKRQFIKDLGNLSQVRVLTINGELRGGGMALQSELVRSLGNLHKLQRLQLVEADFCLDDEEWVEWEDTVVLPRHLQVLNLDAVPFRQLPSCISPAHLQNLYQLCLHVDALDEAGLRALGGLPELCALELTARSPSMASTSASVVASINIAGDGFFQKLRRCWLRGWMIHLVLNKEDKDSMASVSVTFWNGNGAVPFGSRTKQHEDHDDCSSTSVLQAVPPPAKIMPKLQELQFEVLVRALYKDGNGGCHNLGLQFLPSLARIDVYVNCEGATADDVEKAEAELRNAAQLHHNKLILDIKAYGY